MQSDPRTISELFERKIRYVIPIFQRHYVWDEKNQWIPLWNDIRDKTLERLEGREAHPHFLGSLVLAHKKQPTTTQSITTFTVIDGQQRLTTLQLILCAMREVCRRHEQDNLADDIESCLFNQYRSMAESERCKLWPTRFDQETYEEVLTLSFDEFLKKHKAHDVRGNKLERKRKMQANHILGAYLFFEDTISGFVREMSNDEEGLDAGTVIAHLFQALMNDLQIVEIQLWDEDDPQMIFETLNARGTPLSHADLIRNYIFMRAEKAGEDMEVLYDDHWAELETAFWSISVKQGRMTEARLVFFFYNYLLYKTGDEIRFDKIFPAYKGWMLNDEPFSSINVELEDIKQASQVYKVLTQGKEETVLSVFAKKLRRWDITAIYPLIFAIELGGDLDDDERASIYTDLDSYLVRRMICNKTQKNYNKVFLNLSKRLQEMGVNRKNLQTLLLSYNAEINIWPSDGEFEKAWLERPVYRELGSYAVNGILSMLEQQGRTKFNEDISINSALSIEHVMPSSWYEHWPLDGREISHEEWQEADQRWFFEDDDIYSRIHQRKQLLHSFGNLTLLTQSLNSSVSCGPFDQKRKEIIEQSSLALNRYFQNVDEWDEESIRERGKSLFKLATQAWPKPERQADMPIEDDAEEEIEMENDEEDEADTETGSAMKYAPLRDHLLAVENPEWCASFSDIEEVLGFGLPASARKHSAWWSNDENGSHSHALSWQEAGWKTEKIDLEQEQITFCRAA